MANSLELGCDCLGSIHYLDTCFIGHDGRPVEIKKAVCIHEEDDGILWKVRRSLPSSFGSLLICVAYRLSSWRTSSCRSIEEARDSDDCYCRQLRTSVHYGCLAQMSSADISNVGVPVHLVAQDGRNDLARDWTVRSAQSVHARSGRVGRRIWN